jgi:Tol biopolymer transport system component
MRQFVLLLMFASIASAADLHHLDNPSWSPDGKRIAFEAQETDKFAIYTIGADGGGLAKLTSGAANDSQPRWSPDGKRIAFISDRDGHLQIYVMNADGGDQRRVSNSARIDYQPAFSPDGKRIAFVSRGEQPSMIHEIHVMNVDGSDRRRLTDEDLDNSMAPRWSRNGRQILFVRHPVVKRYYKDLTAEERAQVKSTQELMVMSADGSNPRPLTSNQAQDCCASWARDGKIYFLSDRDGPSHVYVMNADGTESTMIANGGIVKQPEISPDGRRFAYTRETAGKWGLFVYDLGTEEERTVLGR